jgi:two-component system LytT family response regulator
MSLSVYILDDESHAVEILKEYIRDIKDLDCIGSNQNSLVAIQEVNDLAPDILFLDIDMPNLNGLSFIKLITIKTRVMFTTAFTQYALNAFENNAFDYLVKPISNARFIQCINKIKFEYLKSEKKVEVANFFYIKCENKGKILKVTYEDILYMESNNNYVMINLKDIKYSTYLTLTEIMNKLPANSFIRIHKSFIVNRNKIQFIDGNQVILIDKTVLQLGSTYKKSFFHYIDSLTIKTNRW